MTEGVSMFHPRVPLVPLLCLVTVGCIPAFAQSVVSTHSGLVYFFEGSVFLGGQKLEQKFGRFPDMGEGGELRTAQGRAEVLLTSGVFLRLRENSVIRLNSNKLSDTRVELLEGSGILESTDDAAGAAVQVIHKTWTVRLPREGVYRIDSEPAAVTVYRGEAQVAMQASADPVAVRSGQTVPLAAVLVPDQAPFAASDDFKNWAMSRSQEVASDNATAAGIVDDPDAMQGSADPLASLTYFPPTGIPGIAVTNPYGLSFWSPFQSTLSAVYFPPYTYSLLYSTGWPAANRHPIWRSPGSAFGFGLSSGSMGGLRLGGAIPPRSTYTPFPVSPLGPRITPATPRPAVSHPMPHPVVHK
jgi:hypothetical protein